MNISSAQGFEVEPLYKIFEIAVMSDVRYDIAFQAIKNLKLVSVTESKPKKYTKYQADLVFEHLYFLGYTTELIIPSKLNGIEFYGQYN